MIDILKKIPAIKKQKTKKLDDGLLRSSSLRPSQRPKNSVLGLKVAEIQMSVVVPVKKKKTKITEEISEKDIVAFLKELTSDNRLVRTSVKRKPQN